MKVVKTLYVVSAWDSDHGTPVHMTFLYAQTRAKAEERGRAWRDECYPPFATRGSPSPSRRLSLDQEQTAGQGRSGRR